MNYHPADIARICGGTTIHTDDDVSINGVSTDSRTIEADQLFVALDGDNFKGSDYLQSCYDKGCRVMLIPAAAKEKGENLTADATVITVPNTILALGKLAADYLDTFKGTRIALTGSAGKTTTRDMLRTMLASSFSVYSSKKNFNNEIGLPLSILAIDKDHDFFIFELGMNHAGEIRRLSAICRPDHTLVTNISSAHIEFFENEEGIARAKAEIFESQSAKGIAFLNPKGGHYKILRTAAEKYAARIIDIHNRQLELVSSINDKGRLESSLLMKQESSEFRAALPFHGSHNLRNIRAALEVALAMGVPTDRAMASLGEMKSEKARFEALDTCPLIIDDSYNANAESMRLGLESLSEISNAPRLCLVLGDMLELGEKSRELHEGIAADIDRIFAGHADIEAVFCGKEMKSAFEKLGLKRKKYFTDNNSTITYLKNTLERDRLYFLKASQGMKFREIRKELECFTT